MSEYFRARSKRGASQTTDIGQRLNCASAFIQQRAGVVATANPPARLLGIENLDRRTTSLPLLSTSLDFFQSPASDCTVQRARGLLLAVNFMLRNKIEHPSRPMAEQIDQALPKGLSQRRRESVRHDPHTGIHETDIASGAAEADFRRLEDRDARSSFSKMESGRKPGISATDDEDIDVHLASQTSGLRCMRSRQFP